MSTQDLSGKVALVTGASRGIGAAIADTLAAAGATVVGTATSASGAAAIGERLAQWGGEGRVLSVGEAGSIEDLIAAIEKEQGKLDILVNNAGIQIRNDVLAFKDEDWDKVINLNLNALYHMSQAAAKYMAKQKHGKIINIGSMQSYRAGKFIFPYTAAKHGVLGLTKAYADALSKYNIQVNGLAPGYILTDMTKALAEDPVRGPEIKEHIPSGEWGRPEQLMGPMVFLASPASDYVTGVMLPVDGGYLLR